MRRLWRQTGLCCRAGLKQFQQTRIMARTARNVDIPSLGALDRAAGDLSRQLAQALRDAVRRGTVHPGDALPSTRLLAASLQVARGTVVDAYAQLIAEGFLESRGGAGTRVANALALAEPPPVNAPNRLRGGARRRVPACPSRPPPSRESPANSARCRPCRSRSRCRSASPRPTTSGAGSATACARAAPARRPAMPIRKARCRCARRSPTTCAARARCAAMPTRS